MSGSQLFKCKVSSTINKDVKNFGKQFMFDGNDETCWNSDKGENQWIQICYDPPITFSNIGIQFQGGFAVETAQLEILDNNCSEDLRFENINLYQNIKLSTSYTAQNIRLKLGKSFDTYGRIIVYHLMLNKK